MSLKNNSDYNIKAQQIQFQRRIDKQPDKHQPLDADVQNFALQMLANIYDNCAEILDEYNKNRGIADAGTYIEGARRVIDWATFGKIKSTAHIKNDLKNKSRELKNINVADEKTFKETFKKLSGIDYNEDNIKELMALVYEQGVDFESDEFKTACNKAFGIKGVEKQQKYVQRSATADGIGDIVLMLLSLGAVSKTKLMGRLTTSLFKTLEKGAGEIFSGSKVQKAAKLGTSMVMGGASLAGFTLTKETLDNITNPMREADKLSTWKQTGIASLESFGFGAMGGLLNETVVGPLVKYLSKPAKQAAQAAGKILSENAEVSGKEILQASVKSQNFNLNGLFKMSPAELKNFGQVLGAHAAGFGVEVVGFAGYEAGLDAIKDICDPKTGRLPEDMTLENLTKYLGHKIGEQFHSLGTIKGISQLLMMSKGGRAAQHAMMSKMIADSEKLSDIKFKKVNDNGSEAIEMSLPDGSKKLISTPEQAIQTCESVLQLELVVNNLKKQAKEETIPEPVEAEPTKETSTETEVKAQETTTEGKVEKPKTETSPIRRPKVEIKQATEKDLKEIQKIDLEAFEGRYEIESDFDAYKADLESQGVTTYTMKAEDGSIIGYYQLEPVKNGELYVYSLGIKKELRGTKTSYIAIKQMQETITKLAQEQNLDKITLDVDSSKPELVKLYKKFGFEITGEDSRSEVGHEFLDYRMTADVKKILGGKSKETAEVVETSESNETIKTSTEEVKETVNPEEKVESPVKASETPFFTVPKADKTLTPIKINQNRDFCGRPYQKDGRNFITISGNDYEIHYCSMDTITDRLFATELYNNAGFKRIAKRNIIDIDGKTGYLEPVSNKAPLYAIEKLDQRFGINIYLDEMDIRSDYVRFYKNGREVRLQIVEESDPRLNNDTENTIFVTNSELLTTLDKLVSINDTNIKHSCVDYKFADNKIPNQEAVVERFLQRQNELNKLNRELKSESTNSHPEIDEAISRGIEEIEFNDGNQIWFDGLLKKPKKNSNSPESFFEYLVNQDEKLKPYLAELSQLIYTYNRDALQAVYYSVDKTNHYTNITVERAASYIKIAKAQKNRYSLNTKEEFEKLRTIPDKFISKCVFVDGITDIDTIKANWDSRTLRIAEEARLQDYTETELTDEIKNDIARDCVDEYGEALDYKTTLAKTLLQYSPEMGKHYGCYHSGGPYCGTSDILRLCQTREQCLEVMTEILPKFKELELSYKEGVTPKEIKYILKSAPTERAERFEALKLLRNQKNSTYDYDQKLDYIIDTPEKLKLYKEMSAQGFSEYDIRKIFDLSKEYPLDKINMEMVEFLKSFEYFKDLDVDINTLRDQFASLYQKAIETNDYDAKVDVVDRLSKIPELVNNPARTKHPLTTEHLCELLKLPKDKYEQVRDALYLKNDEGFEIRVDDDNGNIIYDVINTLSDDVCLKRFYKDYLPLAKKYRDRGLQHGTYLVQLLKAEKTQYKDDIIKNDYQTTLSNLKYLLERAPEFRNNEIVDATLLNRQQFERFRNYLLKIRSLGDNQPYTFEKIRAAKLSDLDFQNFHDNVMPKLPRLFPNKDAVKKHFNIAISDYVNLSPKQLDMIIDAVEYFSPNYKKLNGINDNISVNDVITLIHKNHTGITAIAELAGQKSLFHALEYRFKGLKNLLENCRVLDKLDVKQRKLLTEQLAKLPHPEQRLEKLSVIAGLYEKVSPDALTNIIASIKSPEMTTAQQELADRIFADKNTPYEIQIERFIKEFNVPKSRQDTIRKFLRNENLQEKYITPPPIEKQLEVLDKKIKSVEANDKIPAAKKQAYLEVLNRQKQDVISNPEKYTRRRLNEVVMKALAGQVEAHINLPNETKTFNKAINREIYTILGVEPTEGLLNADIQYDSKYFAKLFSGASDSGFKTQFVKLLELIKANPGKLLTDIYDSMPENRETRKLFQENGLDYDRWIKFDENSYQKFELTVEVEKALKAAKENLKTEMSSELAQKLDQNEVAKLTQILNDMQIDSASQKELAKIMKAVEAAIDNNDYWKQENPAIKEFLDHIKIHKKNIHAVKDLKDSNEELFVRLWDNDDIGRNIFFGNHVGCCTSVGSFNSFAAAQHLMNSFVKGIEIVDKAGNSMGNSMCYFAKVDGELTFVIDSFEANGKLGAAPEVTDAIIDYAKQVCREMGRPDANVMFGPNYNKVNFDRCVKTEGHTVEVVGHAPERTYIDSVGGSEDINRPANNRAMYEIVS